MQLIRREVLWPVRIHTPSNPLVHNNQLTKQAPCPLRGSPGQWQLTMRENLLRLNFVHHPISHVVVACVPGYPHKCGNLPLHVRLGMWSCWNCEAESQGRVIGGMLFYVLRWMFDIVPTPTGNGPVSFEVYVLYIWIMTEYVPKWEVSTGKARHA